MGSVARRSSESWTVTATGKANHSSGIFSAESGDGAIYELARIVHRFRTDLPEPHLTFNVGLIAGGQEVAPDAGGIRATTSGQTHLLAPPHIPPRHRPTPSADQAAAG